MASAAGFCAASSATGMLFTNPGNVYADDTSYATLTSTTRTETDASYWTTFGFAIPDGATITQVVVDGICRIGTTGITGAGWGVQLYKGGTTAVGTEATAATGTANTDYAATQTITTGLPSVAELNASGDSGLRVRARVYTGNLTTSRTWSLDYLRVTVTYTVPGMAGAQTAVHYWG